MVGLFSHKRASASANALHTLLVSAAFLAVALQANAMTPADCVPALEQSFHPNDEPTDFGHGHVLTHLEKRGYHNPSDAWGADEFWLTNCSTGETVWARTAEYDDYGKPFEHFNHTEDINLAVEDLRSNVEPGFWLEEVEEIAKNMGAEVRFFGTDHKESCGCRVFYPELRGDKERYEA